MLDLRKISGFDWDEGNRRKNEKHGVSVGEIEELFFNQPLVIAPDPLHSTVELRFRALGWTNQGRLLHITFTLREHETKIRPISARAMSRKEKLIYAKASQTNP